MSGRVEDGGAGKVGRTDRNVEERKSDLQTGNPNKIIKVMAIENVPKLAEKYFTRRFNKNKNNNPFMDGGKEWFPYQDLQREFVRVLRMKRDNGRYPWEY